MQPHERIDLNLFRVLDAIYSRGGVSAAARVLHLTQPAVTHALRRLRGHLGDPLFVRQGNRLIPTEKVRTMMPAVQAHLAGLQGSVRTQLAFEPAALEAEFTVGLRDILESTALPWLLSRLEREAPGVRVVSRRVLASEAERELASGTVDLVVDRPVRMGARIARQPVAEDTLVVVMRQGHRCASQLRRSDYLAASHVAVSALGETHTLDALLEQGGTFRPIRLVCQHYGSAAQIAAATDLLLTVPHAFAQHLQEQLPVVIRPLPIRLKPFAVIAYWHESRSEDHAHRWFRERVAMAINASLPTPARR